MEYLKEIFAEDTVWHWSGSSQISRDHVGRDAVFASTQRAVSPMKNGPFVKAGRRIKKGAVSADVPERFAQIGSATS